MGFNESTFSRTAIYLVVKMEQNISDGVFIETRDKRQICAFHCCWLAFLQSHLFITLH